MIQEQIENKIKNVVKKKIKQGVLMLLSKLTIPIIVIVIILVLVSFITDIFYIGIKNEEKSNMKNEIKYYTTAEYTDEDSKSFFDSVGDFISGIFASKEIIGNAEFPVVGKGFGNITSYYGKRTAPTSGASTFHSGIDIAAPEGTKLVAIADGEVTRTAWGGAGGYTITIASGEYSFSYCHSDPNFMVKVGDKVEKGQVIGKVGPKNVYNVPGNPYRDSSGNPTNGATTGCHCHFTVKKNGQTINPLTILKGGEKA